MANPFLVIGGVAVGVVTAAIGVLAVPGWIASAQDAAAIHDLAQITNAQGARLATAGTFAQSYDELTTGGDEGTRVRGSNGVTLLGLEADGSDYWCATVQSRSGAYFSASNTESGAFESDTADTGLCGSADSGNGGTVEAGMASFRCDADTLIAAPFSRADASPIPASAGTVTWTPDNGDEAQTLPANESFLAKSGVEYTMSFDGTVEAFSMMGIVNATGALDGISCLRAVSEWPEGITSLYSAFTYADNLESVPATLPKTVTSLTMAFGYANFTGDLSGWDVSNVDDFSYAFYQASVVPDSIAGWDTSGAITMSNMFESARRFDADISGWNVSGVMTMFGMFYKSEQFNVDISRWNVSNVSNMSNMLDGAASFNQDLSGWQIGKVTSSARFADGSGMTGEQLPRF